MSRALLFHSDSRCISLWLKAPKTGSHGRMISSKDRFSSTLKINMDRFPLACVLFPIATLFYLANINTVAASNIGCRIDIIASSNASERRKSKLRPQPCSKATLTMSSGFGRPEVNLPRRRTRRLDLCLQMFLWLLIEAHDQRVEILARSVRTIDSSLVSALIYDSRQAMT